MTRAVQRRALLQSVGLGLGVALLGARTDPVGAHRLQVTLTRVSANTRAGTWEFAHALHFHDAARVLRQLEPARRWSPDSAEGQARLLLEIERAFLWQDPRGVSLQPAAVGAELRADSLWLYQELPAPLVDGPYTVRCTLFHAIDRNWSHSLTLELGEGPPATLRLSAAQPQATFEFRSGRVGG